MFFHFFGNVLLEIEYIEFALFFHGGSPSKKRSVSSLILLFRFQSSFFLLEYCFFTANRARLKAFRTAVSVFPLVGRFQPFPSPLYGEAGVRFAACRVTYGRYSSFFQYALRHSLLCPRCLLSDSRARMSGAVGVNGRYRDSG